MLANKTVLLGVSGGIAAYKAADLCSRLVRLGADVHVLMTAAATRLVAPLTFQALSGRPVITDVLDQQRYGHVDHVLLARKADLMVVAPATANTIASLAAGLAGDPIGTIALGVACPVLICPAMEEHMYAHPLTQANLERLRSIGHRILEPRSGPLASGHSGQGRMAEPEVIVAAALMLQGAAPDAAWAVARAHRETPLPPAAAALGLDEAADLPNRGADLAGLRVLVTAGATREPLDPVRFLSNRSSGKMGYAIAQAAGERGADVVLVSGPTHLPAPAGVQLVAVETAREMHAAVMARAGWLQVGVAAAAVADWRPREYHSQKVKKSSETASVDLVRNPDILADLGRAKSPEQVLVGFAAETHQVREHARSKLVAKNLDLMVANDVTAPGAGFATDTNQVVLIERDGREEVLPILSKLAVGHRIWDWLIARGLPGGTP